MPVKQRKGAAGKADRLFSQLVRGRAVCEARDWPGWPTPHQCSGPLETSHIVPRRYSTTRCDLNNATCLCSSAHRYFGSFHADHVAFVEWWATQTGRRAMALAEGYDPDDDPYHQWLYDKAQSTAKVQWKDVAAELDALAKVLR